jgi:hypothetical protein
MHCNLAIKRYLGRRKAVDARFSEVPRNANPHQRIELLRAVAISRMILREPENEMMADYAPLIRPCNSEIDYRWDIPRGMACRELQSTAGRWRSDRIRPEPLLAAP